MKRYILIRILQLFPVLLGVSVLTFFLAYLAPSDPAQVLLNQMGIAPAPELLEKTREQMGLNQPIPVQYLDWLERVIHGDFGISYKYNEPVLGIITAKLPATLKLAGTSILLMILLAFPLGILAAVYKNKLADYLIRIFTLFGISMPSFWLGLILMYFLTYRFKLLPVLSNGTAMGIILPAVTLAFSMVGKYARQLRTAILEEMSKDYVRGAYARGISLNQVLFFHVLPNILAPIITMLGLSIGGLLGGAAIVESIFVWPGVGEMVVDAIYTRDYPLIQGYVIWMALIYVLINLFVDILYTVLNHEIELD